MYFNAKEFGKRLQSARKMRGLTQAELAERLGLSSKQHISRIERGEKSCSIDLLVDLSYALHVSTDYLLKGEDPVRERNKSNLLAVAAQITKIADEI
ncbi:MAG: helix-turn-helix domain-containing protein [Clostridiales bacterium]|nr:helix-turn-helix domain-containing protein [Clostridiales bacterium]